jgi:hypothetical protein
MMQYHDINTALTVGPDEADVRVTIELTRAGSDIWVEGVVAPGGGHATPNSDLFQAAEDWLERRYEDILRGDV